MNRSPGKGGLGGNYRGGPKPRQPGLFRAREVSRMQRKTRPLAGSGLPGGPTSGSRRIYLATILLTMAREPPHIRWAMKKTQPLRLIITGSIQGRITHHMTTKIIEP